MVKTLLVVTLFFLSLGVLGAEDFEVILVGTAPRTVLEAEQLFPWYTNSYKSYAPDAAAIEVIQKAAPQLKFLVFAGTWCPDTRRELPRFLKVMDTAGISADQVRLIFLDRNKKGKDNSPEENRIQFVPTILVQSDGKELGRIVENTKESMEKDLAAIVKTP